MRKHVQSLIGKSRVARGLLRPVLSSHLPVRTKLRVYKVYIRSLLTYAAPAWYGLISTPNQVRLQAQQNLTLRTILAAHYYVSNHTIHKDLRMESLLEFSRRLATNLFERADASMWDHIRGIAPLHARPPDLHPGERPFPRDFAEVQ